MSVVLCLTQEQEAEFVLLCRKWLEICSCCEPADRPRAEQAITAMYQVAEARPPERFVWVDSPYQASQYYDLARREWNWRWDPSDTSFYHHLCSRLANASVRSGTWEPLWANLADSSQQFLMESVREYLERPLLQLDIQIRKEVEPLSWEVRTSAEGWHGDSPRGIMGPLGESFFSQREVQWLVAYLYSQELGLSHSPIISTVMDLWAGIAQSCCWWWPRREHCVICERPSEIHWRDHQLHRDGGPAVRFRDDWSLWMLDGWDVPRHIAEKPGAQIPLERWWEEKDPDLHWLIEQTIGIGRILQELGAQEVHRATIPIGGIELPYTVLEIRLRAGDCRRLLEMVNPSTGVMHREWIPPWIGKVQEALAWRNGTEELPERIT